MILSDSHARHAAAYSSQNKPWEQLGMTEQDYKSMMADNNPGQQTTSTYQNHQPIRQSDWEQLGMTEQDYKAMMSDSNPGRQQTTSTYQNHQPTRQSDWEQLGMTEQDYKAMMSDDNSTRQQRPASTYQKNQPARQINAQMSRDIANITKPTYLYNEDDIKKILEANLDQNKFSIFHHASLEEPEILKDTLRAATENLIIDNKPAIIPLNTGHEHWLILVAKQDEKGNVKFIYNDPNGNPIGDRPKVTQYINAVYPNAKIEDLKTRQQTNAYDCGVFICDSAIKLANNKPILTTKEAGNKGQELRNQNANMLMNKQPNKFQDLVASQKTSNIRTYGR